MTWLVDCLGTTLFIVIGTGVVAGLLFLILTIIDLVKANSKMSMASKEEDDEPTRKIVAEKNGWPRNSRTPVKL